MGYKELLELAGAKVHCYQEFGSYQGDWLAKVTYDNETFWVRDYFGSCSGCDLLLAKTSGGHHDKDGNFHSFDWDGIVEGCEKCKKLKENLVEWAKKDYLEPAMRYNQEEIEEKVNKNFDWDYEAEKMLKYVKENELKVKGE